MGLATNAGHFVEANFIGYRRTWRGRVISTFVNPVLFLAGLGIALGSMVDAGSGEAQLPIPYITFAATGLLAATAMQTGYGEGAWPIMAGIKWRKSFDAVLATPLGVGDLVSGYLVWGAIHLAFTLGVYAAIAVLFGAIEPLPALVALVPAVLCGVAFQAASVAFTSRLENETGLTSMMRFGIMPMFLFSGTFFPVSQLPDWMEPVAALTPLFHGVELVRKLALPEAGPPVVSTMPLWIHGAYLIAITLIAWLLAIRWLSKRLKS
ncbi:MAG TPA: ABC transporter permease [Acidimicrobiia bacterium]|nr:ABC transporter permease [Acidimicrobiia bacterium]